MMNERNLLPMHELSSVGFSFDVETRTLSAEASTVGFNGPQQIWNDSVDLGVAIKSHHTGNVLVFSLIQTDRSENEITAWHFEPVEISKRTTIARVTIFND